MQKYEVSLTEEEKAYVEKIELNPKYVIVKPANAGKSKTIINLHSGEGMVTYGVVVKAPKGTVLNLKQGDIVHWSNNTFMFNKYMDYPKFSIENGEGEWGALSESDILFKVNQ